MAVAKVNYLTGHDRKGCPWMLVGERSSLRLVSRSDVASTEDGSVNDSLGRNAPIEWQFTSILMNRLLATMDFLFEGPTRSPTNARPWSLLGR